MGYRPENTAKYKLSHELWLHVLWYNFTDVSENLMTRCLLLVLYLLATSLNLRMDSEGFSETSDFYQTTQRHIPENSNRPGHCYKNHKSSATAKTFLEGSTIKHNYHYMCQHELRHVAAYLKCFRVNLNCWRLCTTSVHCTPPPHAFWINKSSPKQYISIWHPFAWQDLCNLFSENSTRITHGCKLVSEGGSCREGPPLLRLVDEAYWLLHIQHSSSLPVRFTDKNCWVV
jgi:hypothetical protein